jgi:hypothetical protein
MAATQHPPASVADCWVERGYNSNVPSLCHGIVHFPRLEAGTYPSGSPLVLANGVIRKELDVFQKMRPYAQGSPAG